MVYTEPELLGPSPANGAPVVLLGREAPIVGQGEAKPPLEVVRPFSVGLLRLSIVTDLAVDTAKPWRAGTTRATKARLFALMVT